MNPQMSCKSNVSIQGVEATLRISRKDNQVEYMLILSSETAKIEVHGGLSLESKEESVPQAEKFNPAYVSEQIEKLGGISLREERKAHVIDIMTYMYEHREAVARYATLLDVIIKKCYELKTQVPDDPHMMMVCNRILTHFGKDVEEKQEQEKEQEKEEEAQKKQEEVLKKQEQDRKTELVVQKYREEVKRDELRLKVYQKDRQEHLQLLEKVANTYRVPFAEKMYDQYLDWKVTYRGNAKNRYVRMCEFVESLPLFQ